jgi:hypothetical protein
MFNFWLISKIVFPITSDGKRLFCPNGRSGPSYIIPSEEVYKRLSRGYIAMFISAMLLMFLGALLLLVFNFDIFLGMLIPAIIFLIGYTVWIRAQTRNLAKL